MKADDKVEYDDGEKMKFTNFEELVARVEVLQETIDELVSILRVNNITKTLEVKAQYVDDDEIYKRLEDN